jgi:proteasome lid subunit RPN8/RPN11|tara:strand:+ start:5714 stop:6037 length:324 start_codon:yes stop_codon:yes gene_type:complete
LIKFIEEIFSYAEKEAPREMCGLIIQENNEEKWIPCENKFLGENQFEFDAKVFAQYQLFSKILYVVHSHYMQDCKPSQHDKNVAKSLGIPFLIVSYPEKGVEVYDPR